MAIGHPAGVVTGRAAKAGQVVGVEPEVVIAQAGVAVRGRPVGTGGAPLGSRFVRYLTAATLSYYGDWFTTVALVVLLYRLSGPAAPAGYMVARVLPRLLSGTPGGALADRFPQHHVVACCAVLQGAVTLAIIPAARIHAVWAVFGAVVVAQFAGGLAKPALTALVPCVVPPQRLDRANLLCGLGIGSSVAIGPALAAPLLAVAGPEPLLVVDAMTFFIAAVLVATLHPARRDSDDSSAGRGMAAGLRVVWSDPSLRATAVSWLASATAVTCASAVLVLIASNVNAATKVGYLYTAVGVGSVIVGPLLLRLRPSRITRDSIVAIAVVDILCLAVVTLRGPFWAVLLPLALNGAAGTAWQTLGTTDMQQRTHPAVLGRATAVAVTASSLGMLLGAVLALALAPAVGWQHTLFIACCVSLAVLIAGVFLGPQQAPTRATD